MTRKGKFDYPAFTHRVVKHLLDTYLPDDMLAWQLEMDNDPGDEFFSQLTEQLRARYPEEFTSDGFAEVEVSK